MKLIAKYNRVNIPITVVVFLISSIAYYFILHYVLLRQVDSDIRIEKQEIIHHIKANGTLPETSNYKDQQIGFQPTKLTRFKEKFSTESIYNKKEDENEPFRRIDFQVTQNGKHYIVTVKKSEQETEDIVRLILEITFSVIAVLLLILFVSNRLLLRKLWKPFRHTLEQLNQFNFLSKNKIQLQTTEIDEFKELNETVLFMTQKVTKDYETLKGFTENASHEFQTPLAIIKSKVELLSQSENLDESQINVLQTLNEATSRLSKLNQSLLLLAKIENLQFAKVDTINFSCILTCYVDNFEELTITKSLKIAKHIQEDVFLQMNEALAGILISNIITNAIKHNFNSNGEIFIFLDQNSFCVSNTGNEPHLAINELFERFKKDSSSQDSLGLGLSIVKTICDTYGFDIFYDYAEGRHIIKILFH